MEGCLLIFLQDGNLHLIPCSHSLMVWSDLQSHKIVLWARSTLFKITGFQNVFHQLVLDFPRCWHSVSIILSAEEDFAHVSLAGVDGKLFQFHKNFFIISRLYHRAFFWVVCYVQVSSWLRGGTIGFWKSKAKPTWLSQVKTLESNIFTLLTMLKYN